MTDQVGTGAARHEIAFVSGNLPDLQNLILGLREGIEVVVLDPAVDGMAQIAQALAGRSDLDAIHLIGHGAAGALQIGGTLLDAGYIAAHADALAGIGSSLNGDGDILVYGCDTGAGTVGDTFLHTLAAATGADVAASTNPSGGTAAGGDWNLSARAARKTGPPIRTSTCCTTAAPTAIPAATARRIRNATRTRPRPRRRCRSRPRRWHRASTSPTTANRTAPSAARPSATQAAEATPSRPSGAFTTRRSA